MVIAGVLTVVAMRNSDQAEHEATIATARELAAAAVGSLQSDPERSLLLALEAVETTRRSGDKALPEAQEALHQAVIGSRVVRSFNANGGSAALSSDGVLGDPLGGGTRLSRSSRCGHGPPTAPSRRTAARSATSHSAPTAACWLPPGATGPPLGVEHRHRSAGGRGATTWRGRQPVLQRQRRAGGGVVGGRDGRGHGQRFRHGARTLRGVDWAGPIDLSPDGRRAVYSHGSGAVIALVDTGNVVMPLAGEYPANDVAWSPNGRRVAVVSNGGAGEIWDARTGRRTLILPHRGIILAVAWAPDSSHLVTGALDGTARVWETHAEDVTEVARLSAQDTSSGIDRVGSRRPASRRSPWTRSARQ